MIDVAELVRTRRHTVARTLRESFGVGLSQLGGDLTWGEAKLLLEEASADPATQLGAELAEWAYPATLPMLLTLAAQVGNEKALKNVMPWSTALQSRTGASTDEIAAAEAELEAGIIFAQ